MAPAIKDEKTADENRDLMEVDEEHASEMEEQEEEEEEEDEDMDEEPDVAVSADKIEIVGTHADPTAMTFCFKEEDHTLGNSLRHVINKNPDVDFCGYSIPHPSVAKMNVRIQTTEKTNAIEALKTGLSNLHDLVAHVRETYDEELKKETFTRFEEIA